MTHCCSYLQIYLYFFLWIY